ncbi:MAG: AAA family ATPase [Candidatus Omnitrophica bacterium]|nr:AAA family ATPase [Candidatus Omnitrophota bacterium]
MYLKELEIFGFKSFPQKTRLSFEPGITVVVGPNGCGKSNVFDSIKWALGEQSPKSLRGAKMEDIIFNGTENHPPLNYAEVYLTFCNEDNYLPIEYKEVSVGRRLYRSGESQYFINKNPVRLKDVQELFMGTGIGEATYSFVEQGKIEIFLSYKPEDKRLIFDEASGIVKYKERRKETFRKLKEAEDNLLRLDDILSEVRRQIRYLERQVEKAKQYKEVQADLVEAEKKIATVETLRFGGKIDIILDELTVLEKEQSSKDSQLSEENQGLLNIQKKLDHLRTKLEETITSMVSLKAQNESSANNIAVYKQRLNELNDRNAYLFQSKADINHRLANQEQKSQEEFKRLETIETSFSEVQNNIDGLGKEKSNLAEAIKSAKEQIDKQKRDILNYEGARAQLHNRLIEIQANLNTLANRKKRLMLDSARLENLLSDNQEKFEISIREHQEHKEKVSRLEDERNSLRTRENQIISTSENIRQTLIDKEKEHLELSATFEFLKDLRIKYETFSVKKKITVIFDEEPKNINKLVASLSDVEFKKEGNAYKAELEVKVVNFEEKQLQEKISLLENDMSALTAKLSGLDQEKSKLLIDLQKQNSMLEQEKGALQECLQEKDTLEREVLRLKEESEILEQEKKDTVEDIEDSQKKQKELEAEVLGLDDDLRKVNESLSACHKTIDDSSERIKYIDIETATLQGQIQSLHKEKEALSSKLSFFKEELQALRNNLEQVDKETQDNAGQSISFANQIQSLEKKISENKIKIDELTSEKLQLDGQELSLTAETAKIKDAINEYDKQSQQIRNSVYNKKLQVQSLEYEKEKIKDYINQVYNIEFMPLERDSITESFDELTSYRDKLQKKVKSLGEVNLVAIEEFEELKQRNDFLENQKQDLITSKENLKKAISKINRTSKELFIKTFEQIQTEFKNNFRFLFNGGRANLILLDQDNILESGVEIEVQPPGKKLQNVSLLSGGEKSLTAIALIFAIFQVRPSPLCVLDEIDAPLDEANVDRFNHILKDFATHSQFVLISHNKKTMSKADVLYGVTMEERGISKLVSVKFAAEASQQTTPAA